MVMLRAENLVKTFGGLSAVSDINLDVSGGEILGLIGPNGAGKTTLFNLLTGFFSQDGGTVTLEGKSIDRLSPEQRCARGLVRTFQIVQPFKDISVLENVVMGTLLHTASLKDGRRQAEEILETVGLSSRRNSLGRSLPIGDRKRLELAKALATRPKVLLLDEVMGGLIPVEVASLIRLLNQLKAKGMATILIEHNMSAVMKVSDRILVLHHGSEISRGTPAEVSRDPVVLEAYLGENFNATGA